MCVYVKINLRKKRRKINYKKKQNKTKQNKKKNQSCAENVICFVLQIFKEIGCWLAIRSRCYA